MPATLLSGRYQLGDEIGRGGMGVVYRGSDALLGRSVAIKCLHAPALDARVRRRFLREARAAARLDHPHIVALHEIGEDDGVAFLIMEMLEGPTLRQQPPERLADGLAVCRQLALALAHAHARGIVHRDIKPENVVVVSRDPVRVKLLDFGLAAVQGASRQTRDGAVLGTFTYLAPEQALGAEPDGRADLYALGVVLYELVTGRPPFTGASAQAVLAQHLRAAPEPPRRRRPELPEALDALVLQLLAKDPAARPPSGDAVAQAIEAVEAELAGVAPPRASLPAEMLQLSALIGRDEALGTLAAWVTGGSRLVTLTGPGGIGKTRLAMQLALDLRARGTTVVFVSLVPLADPDLVLPALARALGAGDDPALRPVDAIADALGDRTAVAVLDNFEHLLGARAEVAPLLERCGGLSLVVTSRQLLRVSLEREFPVPALEVNADAGVLEDAPAIALFVRRAREARPDFVLTDENAEVIAALCSRLDGLPLAIELAAARAGVLPPRVLLEQLERGLGLRILTTGASDRPDRQRTLHATIAWSVDQLASAEQLLFRRLAIFAGSAALPAIEAVCAGALSDAPLLDALQSLVERHLLRRVAVEDEARFDMLQTIQEFARERLAASGEEEIAAERHATHHLALAESAAPQLRGRDNEAPIAALERDLDNHRAALAWVFAHAGPELRSRYAVALRWFWALRGRPEEGRRWLLAALDAGDAVPPATRAAITSGAAVLSHDLGDLDGAARWHAESLALCRATGNDRGVNACLNNLAIIAMERGAYEEAVALLDDALARTRTTGPPEAIGNALINMSAAVIYQGDHARAAAMCEEALAIKRRTGDDWGAAAALDNLGVTALYRGDLAGAAAWLEESIALWRRLGDVRGTGRALIYDGRVALTGGATAAAAAALAEAARTLHAVGDRGMLGEALEGLAAVRLARGDGRLAAQLTGAAALLRERTRTVVHPPDRPAWDALQAGINDALGEAEARRMRARGRAMPLDEVVAAATGE